LGHPVYFYWPYSNEIFHTKALEYKEYFTQIDLWGILRSSRDIQDFLDMKYRIFGQAEAGIKVGPDCGPGRIRLGRIFRKFRNIRIFREMLLTQMEVCILSRVIYGFHLFPSTKLTLRNLINF
jgi:hypothetical protein